MKTKPPVQETTSNQFRRGQRVIAGDEQEIGEVLGVITRNDAPYLHIRRYGAGEDEMYVPTIAVYRTIGKRVYLHLDSLDLVGEPWHKLPPAAFYPADKSAS